VKLGNTFGTVSGLAIGAYFVGVAINGNTTALISELQTEKGYIYFLGSLFAIGALQKYGPTSKITDALLLLSIAGVAIKLGTNVDLQAIRKTIFPDGN
jgi:hypothetical protein